MLTRDKMVGRSVGDPVPRDSILRLAHIPPLHHAASEFGEMSGPKRVRVPEGKGDAQGRKRGRTPERPGAREGNCKL